jgi:dimethylargininase
VAAGEFIDHPAFYDFEVIPVGRNEEGAANCIACHGQIIMPAGFPETREKLRPFATDIIEVDISEFAKIDGGLTCLSLRF